MLKYRFTTITLEGLKELLWVPGRHPDLQLAYKRVERVATRPQTELFLVETSESVIGYVVTTHRIGDEVVEPVIEASTAAEWTAVLVQFLELHYPQPAVSLSVVLMHVSGKRFRELEMTMQQCGFTRSFLGGNNVDTIGGGYFKQMLIADTSSVSVVYRRVCASERAVQDWRRWRQRWLWPLQPLMVLYNTIVLLVCLSSLAFTDEMDENM